MEEEGGFPVLYDDTPDAVVEDLRFRLEEAELRLMDLHKAHIGLSEALGGVRMAQLMAVDADALGFPVEDRIQRVRDQMEMLEEIEDRFNPQPKEGSAPSPPDLFEESFREDLAEAERWMDAMATRFKALIQSLIPR